VEGYEASTRDSFTPFGEGRGALRAAKQWLDLVETTSAMKEFTLPGADAGTIAQLPMPVLLMYGEYSRCMPTLRALRPLLPKAEVHIVPRGGHFFPLGNYAASYPHLAKFLGVPATAPDPAVSGDTAGGSESPTRASVS
jgi:pimeloyl-ACP methyl ester carboxylesterase